MPNPVNSPLPGPRAAQPAAAGFNLDDAYYILFRHKWLLLVFTCLGVVATIIVKLVMKPDYVSVAKLQLSYVADAQPVAPSPGSSFVKPDDRGASLLNSEVELLTSVDVSEQAATLINPADLLTTPSGDANRDRMAAASIINGGLMATVQRNSDVILVTFRHPNRPVVQRVLNAIVSAYTDRSYQVRSKFGVFDEFFTRQRDDLARSLRQTQGELDQIMTNLDLVDFKAQRAVFVEKLTDLKREMIDLQKELYERKKALGEPQANASATNTPSIPEEKSQEYSLVLSDLQAAINQEREYLRRGRLTESNPLVVSLRDQMQNLKRQKASLEGEFPELAQYAAASTNTAGFNLAEERRKIAALSSRMAANAEIYSNLVSQARDIIAWGPKISELEQRRDDEQERYKLYAEALRRAQVTDALGVGKATSFNIYQKPSPPYHDNKKLMKLLGLTLFGCIGFGAALAFGWELVFNRTIRRISDVERNLRMPLFVSIPDFSGKTRLRLPWGGGKQHANGKAAGAVNGEHGHLSGELAPLEPENRLTAYTEALRDRLITYFEVNNLTHKPKLVAVSGCGHGAGVTSIATGLAAALSETGDGNVLLVDMNLGLGAAHQFYKGKPTCGIADVLEPDARADAQVQENLYLATVHSTKNEMLPKVLPKRFMHLVPKLRASDYDYIIFDMPPVSQTSVTARLSGHMDMVLMVLESEKTGQELAKRASALLGESRANVAAVLNKCRKYVPASIAQEL